MATLQWTEDLSVGNPYIDADHRGLFDLIQELNQANMTDGLLSNILRRLEDYTAYHFAREEEMMRDIGYPDYDAHIQMHHNFVEWLDTVKTIYRRAAESPFQVGDLVNAFLGEWLTKHIMEEDMKYRDFI
ncbi:MAG: bacteriohemerythrin [Magnetospiraceae bacterium]